MTVLLIGALDVQPQFVDGYLARTDPSAAFSSVVTSRFPPLSNLNSIPIFGTTLRELQPFRSKFQPTIEVVEAGMGSLARRQT